MKLQHHIIILFTVLTTPLCAQQPWTLEACINYALEHNLTVKDAKYSKQAAQETYKQSVRDMLPSVGGFSDYNIRYGRSVNPNDNSITNTDFFSSTYGLSSSLDIFQGFKKWNTLRASKFLHQATKEDVLQQQFLLSFRVMNAFYDIEYFKGLLAISKQQLAISESNFKLVEKQIDLGLKAGADLYETESTLYNDKLAVTQNTNLLQEARLKLKQEMMIEASDSVFVTSVDAVTIPKEETPDVETVFNTAKATVPLLKAQDLRVKAAKKQLAASRGDYYPRLSAFANYGTVFFETNQDKLGRTIPFRTQFADNAARSIGLSLEVPIFNKWALRSRVKQQKIAWLQAQNNLAIQEQVLYQQIQQLSQEHKALQAEYLQSQKQVIAQEQTFKVAQKRYEKGLLTIMDLNQAKTDLATSKNTSLQVRLKLAINTKTLDFYNGLSPINIVNN